MHCYSTTSTVRLPSTTAGRMAPVGQEAIRVGISQALRSASCLICGGLRWIPRMAISEQCTAPHMFTQQASATRSLAGRSWRVKCGYSSSIRALTMPEASVAAEWQWIQPWVCTTLLMELLVPPTGKPASCSSRLSGSMLAASSSRNSMLWRLGKGRKRPEDLPAGAGAVDVGRIVQQELDVMAAGEAQEAARVLVGERIYTVRAGSPRLLS